VYVAPNSDISLVKKYCKDPQFATQLLGMLPALAFVPKAKDNVINVYNILIESNFYTDN